MKDIPIIMTAVLRNILPTATVKVGMTIAK